MNLDPSLLAILACPCDRHEPLRTGTSDEPNSEALECTYCLTRFAVRDDIPVMLLDEAEPGPAGIGVAPGAQGGVAPGAQGGTAPGQQQG